MATISYQCRNLEIEPNQLSCLLSDEAFRKELCLAHAAFLCRFDAADKWFACATFENALLTEQAREKHYRPCSNLAFKVSFNILKSESLRARPRNVLVAMLTLNAGKEVHQAKAICRQIQEVSSCMSLSREANRGGCKGMH